MAFKRQPKKNKPRKVHLENQGVDWYYLIPLIMIGAFVPTIVYLEIIPLPPHISYFWGTTDNIDLFSYHKARWLLILTGIAVFFAMFNKVQGAWQLKKDFIYIPISIFTIMVILSAFFADFQYRDIALKGAPDRYEGMYVWLAYVIITLIAMNIIQTEKHVKVIIGGLLFSASVLSIIGISQFIGRDIFRTNIVETFIIPSYYLEYVNSLRFNISEFTIYGTFYNSNYVGGYMAMMLILSIGLFLFSKNRKMQILIGIATCLIFSNWIGANSRAGIVGGIVALIYLFIILYDVIRIKWRDCMIMGIALVLIFFTMNSASDGRILNNYRQLFALPSIINIVNAETEYNKEIQFQDLVLVDNKATIDMLDQKLEIEFVKTDSSNQYKLHNFIFYGYNGVKLESSYYKDTMEIRINDEEYKKYRINIEEDRIMIRHERLRINLGIDDDGAFHFLDRYWNKVHLDKAAAIGFEGRELMGSSRGYIWSRSIPMLKETLFVGHGPDTYLIYFPQDYVAKQKYLGSFYGIVDKPHNMYLQIGINTGVISLLAFLSFISMYIISSIKLYYNLDVNNLNLMSLTGAICSAVIISYLVTGGFNDSVVSVSPVFWLLLGVGLACNYATKNLETKYV